MAGATLTTYGPVIKELWRPEDINNLAFQGSAFWAMVKKETDFYENIKHVPLQYGNPQGRSTDFTVAQAQAGSSSFKGFHLTRASDYAVGIVDGETLEATSNNKGSLVSAIERETRGALAQLSRSLHISLWSDGSGEIGQISSGSTVASTSITLADVNDIVNFEVGQEIVAAATATGSLRSGSATVTAIDRDAGTLTTDSNWSTQITSLATGDYLFVKGDAADGGSVVKATGIPGWIPTTKPSAGDSFFTVDRSDDTTRLAGVRYDGSGDGTIEEAIIKGFARVKREGKMARPDKCFMNSGDFGAFKVQLGSKVDYVETKVAGMSFSGVRSNDGLEIYEDPQTPSGYAYLLTMDTWAWAGLMETPRFITHDGMKTLRQSSADGVEFRCVYRGNLYCTAPGWNAVVTLPI